MDFFSHCVCNEDLKATYRKLAMCFHPDKGGDPALMVELQKQYEAWQPKTYSQDKYQFNTINRNGANHNRNSTIPFDHPIRDEIRDLQGVIAQLEREKEQLIQQATYYCELAASKSRMIDEVAKEAKEYFDKLKAIEDRRKKEMIMNPYDRMIKAIKEWWVS
jgi:curved DNA-binding protein CbpA